MDPRRSSPHTLRNREPILAVLRRVLPASGSLLEIASGSGEHAVFFAAAFPSLVWWPSDVDPSSLASIEAWREQAALPNLMPPLALDVSAQDWSVAALDAVFNANMIHIAPWEVCEGLMGGVGRSLRGDGVFVMYGPFRIGGAHTASSNAAFDARLREENPGFGVRDLEAVVSEAERSGLTLLERVSMPANNFCLVFRARIPFS